MDNKKSLIGNDSKTSCNVVFLMELRSVACMNFTVWNGAESQLPISVEKDADSLTADKSYYEIDYLNNYKKSGIMLCSEIDLRELLSHVNYYDGLVMWRNSC